LSPCCPPAATHFDARGHSTQTEVVDAKAPELNPVFRPKWIRFNRTSRSGLRTK
jgi:hypothetical protein